MKLKSCRIAPFTLLVIVVNFVSLSAIALLCFEAFEPLRAVFVGAVLSALALVALRVEVVWRWGKVTWAFVFLVLLGLFLRFEPYQHFYGAQDQGLYTNFSELLTWNKGVQYTDEFRSTLDGSQTELYDREAFLPGTNWLSGNQRVVAFYPLHPVWMSISRTLLGEGRNSWSNLMFAFVGVYSLYLATVLIFKSRRAGAAVAVLLTINPALVFFTKFPVAETAALAFSSTGFLYLLVSLRQAEARPRALYFLISLLSFASFCFVKMQFLFYLPFFGILAGAFLYIANRRTGRAVSLFSLGGFLVFGLSMVFYERYQPNLFYGVFRRHIGFLLNDLAGKPLLLAAVVLPTLGLLVGVFVFFRRRGGVWMPRLVGLVNTRMAWLIPIGVLISIPSLYQLIKTGQMVPFSFEADAGDWTSFRFHSGFRLLQMLGPCLFLGFLLLPRIRVRSTAVYGFLILFIFCNWLVTLTQPWVPYLYYYGRYLAVDIVPFAIVLVGGCLFGREKGRKILSRISFGVTVVYFLAFSLVQVGVHESEDGKATERVLQEVGPDDILAISDVGLKFETRLKLKERINVYDLGRDLNPDSASFAVLKGLLKRQTANGHRLFLMQRSGLPLEYPQFRGRVVSRFEFLINGEHGGIGVGTGLLPTNPTGVSFGHYLLPFSSWIQKDTYFLYELDLESLKKISKQTPSDVVLFSTIGFPSQLRLTGFSSPEERGAWTDSEFASIRFKLDETVDYSRFVILGHVYTTLGHSQVVKVLVNGRAAFEKEFIEGENNFEIEIPFDGKASSELLISFEFPGLSSPLEQGEGSDKRKLGMFIREIRFK